MIVWFQSNNDKTIFFGEVYETWRSEGGELSLTELHYGKVRRLLNTPKEVLFTLKWMERERS